MQAIFWTLGYRFLAVTRSVATLQANLRCLFWLQSGGQYHYASRQVAG